MHCATNSLLKLKVAKVVDEHGTAVILKNNVPKYLVIDFSKAEKEKVASNEDVFAISERLIKQNAEDGTRDEGMLDLALNNLFQSFIRKKLYPSIQAKAARLCFGLVRNHAMLDGNKRLGTHVMLVFLALNGYELSYSQKELSDVILELASGNIGEKEILQWIIEHQQ